MVSRDYRKEIGAESGSKMLSKPVAYGLLLVVFTGAFFAARTLMPARSSHEAPPTAHAGGH